MIDSPVRFSFNQSVIKTSLEEIQALLFAAGSSKYRCAPLIMSDKRILSNRTSKSHYLIASFDCTFHGVKQGTFFQSEKVSCEIYTCRKCMPFLVTVLSWGRDSHLEGNQQ